jgi:Raf kinase inhibitor-like YbhB/YbcL family protein
VLVLAGCGGSSSTRATRALGGAIKLTSPAFARGAAIPARYTCDGADRSPPLAWSQLPSGTAALALTIEDLDAPGRSFVHWAIVGLPAELTALAEGARPAGAVEGRNDFGKLGYNGPCPPRGSQPHRYRVVLYALRSPLALSSGFRIAEEGSALAKDTRAFGELIGTYRR